jgi:C1A family cysteine protease
MRFCFACVGFCIACFALAQEPTIFEKRTAGVELNLPGAHESKYGEPQDSKCCGQQFVQAGAIKIVITEKPNGQQPVQAKVRMRGRKNPPQQVLQARHALAKARHRDLVSKLPKATPATFNAAALGWVVGVMDQGQCGSCWDFSGTEMVSSAFIKVGAQQAAFQLSPQYTLDCGQNGGCNGDDNVTVLQWAQATGLPTTADYGPYNAAAGTCNYKAGMTLYKISSWGYCTPAQQQGQAATQDIKNCLVQYGAIGTGVAAGADWDNYQAGQVLTGQGGQVDHDVMIIGWDDAKSGGAWLVRNSWGTSWGDNGNLWIAYGAEQIGYEAVWCTAAAGPPPPASGPTGSLNATPSMIQPGGSAVLQWQTTNGVSAMLNGNTVALNDSQTVSPTTTTLYTLTVTGATGTTPATTSATVTVGATPPMPPGPTPTITLVLPAATPAGTTTFVPENAGGLTPAEVQIIQSTIAQLQSVLDARKKGK